MNQNESSHVPCVIKNQNVYASACKTIVRAMQVWCIMSCKDVRCARPRKERSEDKENMLHLQHAHMSFPRAGRNSISVFTRPNAAVGTSQTGIGVDIPFFIFVIVLSIFGVSGPAFLHGSTSVPSQGALDALEPLSVSRDHGGKRILTSLDGDIVTLAELNTAFAVEGTVCCRARCNGDRNAE